MVSNLLFNVIVVGEVKEALNLESAVFEDRYGASKPSQDADIVFHCRSGIRSLVAISMASKLGYSRFV